MLDNDGDKAAGRPRLAHLSQPVSEGGSLVVVVANHRRLWPIFVDHVRRRREQTAEGDEFEIRPDELDLFTRQAITTAVEEWKTTTGHAVCRSSCPPALPPYLPPYLST